jgi:hypothetical protein
VFGFESELEASLMYMPMAVRFKLDKSGIKLSLNQWQQLSESNRRDLLATRCESESEISNYRCALETLIRTTIGEEPRTLDTGGPRPWETQAVPSQITQKCLELGVAPPTPFQWRALTPLQRFALLKLTRDGDHSRNLIPALREFAGLIHERADARPAVNDRAAGVALKQAI